MVVSPQRPPMHMPTGGAQLTKAEKMNMMKGGGE